VNINAQELSNESWTSDVLSLMKNYLLIFRMNDKVIRLKLRSSVTFLYLQGKSDLGTLYVAETTGYKRL